MEPHSSHKNKDYLSCISILGIPFGPFHCKVNDLTDTEFTFLRRTSVCGQLDSKI